MTYRNLIIFILVSLTLLLPNNSDAADDEFYFLIDVSKSMIGEGDGLGIDIFDDVKFALRNLAENHIADTSGLIVVPFEDAIIDDVEYTFSNPGERDRFSNFVTNLQATGSRTGIYDALDQILDRVNERNPPSSEIYLLTDGKDNASDMTIEQVIDQFRLVKASNPNVYLHVLRFYSSPDDTLHDDLKLLRQTESTVVYFPRGAQNLRVAITELMGKLATLTTKLREQNQINEQLRLREKELEDQLAKFEDQLLSEGEDASALRDSLKRVSEELQRVQQKREKEKKEQNRELSELRDQNARLISNSREIARFLIEIDSLLVDGSKESLLSAQDRVNSILDLDSKNLEAKKLRREIKRRIRDLLPLWQRYWYLLILGLIAVVFVVLLIRMYASKFFPDLISCSITYNILSDSEDDNEIQIKHFSRKLFRKYGTSYTIGSEFGDIIIPSDAITSRDHAAIFRKRNTIFIHQLLGKIQETSNGTTKEIALDYERILEFSNTTVSTTSSNDIKRIKIEFRKSSS